MDILIRDAEERDFPALVSLWNNELGNLFVTHENSKHHFKRLAGDNRYKTLVAQCDGTVLGFITSVWSYAAGLPVGFMHITGIAVSSGARGRGLGEKLITAMEGHAASLGISSVIINCKTERVGAHALYERLGFRKDSFSFDKLL